MTLYAFDAIDDAIEATRAFLWPFDLGRWARLALVVFFVGSGGGSANPFQFSNFGGGGGGPGGPGTPGGPDVPGTVPSIGGAELAVVAAIVLVALLIVLVFAVVGSIMEFVLVESLRREEVTVRRYWGEHWGDGLRLFGFRLVLGVVTLGIAGFLVAVALAPLLLDGGGSALLLTAFAVPTLVVAVILSGLVNGFTTVFVVPVMVAEGRGVLAAWRRFWPTMSGQWKQYAVYAVMGFVLQIAAGIVAGIVTLIGVIALLVPFGIVGVAGFLLYQAQAIAGGVVLAVVALLFVIAVVALVLLVGVPVQTFLRYYALFVLGDTNDEFDLIAERRAAVREDDASASGAAG